MRVFESSDLAEQILQFLAHVLFYYHFFGGHARSVKK